MKKIVKIGSEIPLVGTIMFGLIDRGTNLIQVRPTTICNLNCPFCSTDAGEKSKYHITDYVVELAHLVKWFKEVVDFKGYGVEANIDSVGEPLTYPKIVELIKKIAKIKNVGFISMQTNGTLLTKELVDKLEKAGLNRINLSINALDNELAKKLSGTDWYDIDEIKKIAEYVAKSKIELLIAPVWLPNVNDKEIVKLIKFAEELNCKIGIQKYEIYKYSRKMKEAEKINWWKFYKRLEKWEKEFGIKLRVRAKDLGIEKRERLPTIFKKGEKIYIEVKADGWMQNQMIGVAKNRASTIVNCKAKVNDKIRVRILENKNNLYVCEKIT